MPNVSEKLQKPALSSNKNHLSVQLKQTSPVPLDVELNCKPGELLALVGPSGSGKSTVLRTIAGLQSAAHAQVLSGQEVWLNTRDGINLPPQQRRTGLVFQHYALFPHKSALQNVMLAIQGSKRKSRQQAALNWLNKTNMSGLEHRKPSSLSGGQCQRVALARALAREPRVLLLDEPFSAVDQQTRRRLYRELAQLRSSLPIPIILVTHDLHEVQQLADSLCLIHKGKSLQQGSVQKVISAPNSKTIAKLLGHQNLISASVLQHQQAQTIYQLSPNQQLLGPRVAMPTGQLVTLHIPRNSIDLYSGGETDAMNIIPGIIRDAVPLGDEYSYRIHLDTVSKSLRFRLPAHRVSGKLLIPGTAVQLSIRLDGIHAMKD